MKATLAILIFVLISLTGYSQFTKGTIMAGGSFSSTFNTDKSKVGTTTTTNGKTTDITLNPQVGYFFMDNFAAGAGIIVSSSKFKADASDFKSTNSTTALAPFARYYFDKFYGQAQFAFGSAKDKTESGGTSTETKSSVSAWNLAVGYAYLLNDHVAIEPQIGYGSQTQKNKSNDNKDIQAGPFIKIGLQIYLSK